MYIYIYWKFDIQAKHRWKRQTWNLKHIDPSSSILKQQNINSDQYKTMRWNVSRLEFLDGACRWLTLEATFQVRFLVRCSNESNLSKPGLSVAPFPELLPKRAIQNQQFHSFWRLSGLNHSRVSHIIIFIHILHGSQSTSFQTNADFLTKFLIWFLSFLLIATGWRHTESLPHRLSSVDWGERIQWSATFRGLQNFTSTIHSSSACWERGCKILLMKIECTHSACGTAREARGR